MKKGRCDSVLPDDHFYHRGQTVTVTRPVDLAATPAIIFRCPLGYTSLPAVRSEILPGSR